MRYATLILLVGMAISSCSPNNVEINNDLKKHFDANKVQGCFALMDNGTGKFTVYNLARYRDSSYLPASTFKIVNSLIGLQQGTISNDSMIIKWDGVTRRVPQWNKDLTMYEAFRVSSVPYYQEVARRLGKDTLQYWLDTLKYGSRKIVSAVDTFWLDNSLKITPDEQLGLVKRLYFGQLPFFRSYQEMVKRAMLFEDDPNYRLSYKTGMGHTENGNLLGWVVGWIEENKHPYFFVLNIESADGNLDMKETRTRMLKEILTDLGFFRGAM